MNASATLATPRILRLDIERFRGIESFKWLPRSGLNLILGGGDSGKTTILDAIALLLSPTNSTNISDIDYYARSIQSGFHITATFDLPPSTGVNRQLKPAWPWAWNGQEAVVPSSETEPHELGNPVYKLRVRGSEDLELVYEIVQPDGTTDHLSANLRRSIGVVRLGSDDRNDRDLRLIQGSALDRLLSDKGLRSRLTSELAQEAVQDKLLPQAQALLTALDTSFQTQNLPSGLDLAITGGQGMAVTALIGLRAHRGGVQLPLSSWGAGTRRLSALTIAEATQNEAAIAVIDELERGLEPYRQRGLVTKLQSTTAQVFATTHSAAALSVASSANVWFVDHKGNIGSLERRKIANHLAKDPDTFLARLALVAEGATEVGFVTALLEKAVGSPLVQHGIHITDGNGNESSLDLLEALSSGRLRFGGFVDNEEGKHQSRWLTVASSVGNLLFRWETGCIESNFINALQDADLDALIVDPDGERTGDRLRTLADRLNVSDKSLEAIRATAGEELRKVILEAALGEVPPDKSAEKKEYRAHAQRWFKTISGGRELMVKLLTLRSLSAFKAQLMPFCNSVRNVIGLPAIEDIVL